jgi:hypothetical protein
MEKVMVSAKMQLYDLRLKFAMEDMGMIYLHRKLQGLFALPTLKLYNSI